MPWEIECFQNNQKMMTELLNKNKQKRKKIKKLLRKKKINKINKISVKKLYQENN